MIKVIFECGGCDKTASARMARKFTSITGKSWGFGSYHTDTIEEITPDGWIGFDPHTQCTYCPECWASIGIAITRDFTILGELSQDTERPFEGGAGDSNDSI